MRHEIIHSRRSTASGAPPFAGRPTGYFAGSLLLVAFAISFSAAAAQEVIDIDVKATFNADVIVNDGAGWLDGTQDWLDCSGYAMVTQSAAARLFPESPDGLPDDGSFPASEIHPAVRLAFRNDDYDANARQLSEGDWLEFDVPLGTYEALHLFLTGGNGWVDVTVELRYEDGTTESAPARRVPDWFDDPDDDAERYRLIDGLDRLRILGASSYDDANDAAIFGLRYTPQPDRRLQRVRVTRVASAEPWCTRLNFFGATGIRHAEASCHPGREFQGRCYAYVDYASETDLSIQSAEAEQECVSRFGGRLASIHSRDEDDFISSLMQPDVDPTAWPTITPWIGATDVDAEGTWTWTDGSPFDFANWKAGEPNGGPGENCSEFWPVNRGYFAGWNDVPCDEWNTGFICKWDAPAAAGVTVSPPQHAFGRLFVGETRTRVFQVRNVRATAQDVTVSLAASADFALCQSGAAGCQPPPPVSLAPGGTSAFEVRFSPLGVGVRQATIAVGTPAGTVHVALAGEGTTGAAGNVIVQGTVSGPTDPLEGVRIELDGSEAVLTADDGHYVVQGTVAGEVTRTMVAEKSGYVRQTLTLSLTAGTYEQNLHLIPAPADPTGPPSVTVSSKYGNVGLTFIESATNPQLSFTANVDWGGGVGTELAFERVGADASVLQRWRASCGAGCPNSFPQSVPLNAFRAGDRLRVVARTAGPVSEEFVDLVVAPVPPLFAALGFRDKGSSFYYVSWLPIEAILPGGVPRLRLPDLPTWVPLLGGVRAEVADAPFEATFDLTPDGAWSGGIETNDDTCKRWPRLPNCKLKFKFAALEFALYPSVGAEGVFYPAWSWDELSIGLALRGTKEWKSPLCSSGSGTFCTWVNKYLKDKLELQTKLGLELAVSGSFGGANAMSSEFCNDWRRRVEIKPALFLEGQAALKLNSKFSVFAQGKARGEIEFFLCTIEPQLVDVRLDLRAGVQIWYFKASYGGGLGLCAYRPGERPNQSDMVWGSWWGASNQQCPPSEMTFTEMIGDGEPSMADLAFQPMPRDYLGDPDYARFVGGGMDRTARMEGGATQLLPLEENVFDASVSTLVSSGEELFLAWVWDDPSRPDAARTSVRFSRWSEADGWSQPESIDLDDDGTADFQPTLVALDDGSVVAAWEDGAEVPRDSCDGAPETDCTVGACSVTAETCRADADCPQDQTCLGTGCAPGVACAQPGIDWVARNFDVSAARYVNGSWQPAQRFGIPQRLEHSPVAIPVTSGGAILLWVANETWSSMEEGEILGSRLHPNTLWSARLEGGEWSAPAPVAELPFKFSTYDAVFHQGRAYVVLSLCEDFDSDGACDVVDNCPQVANGDQADGDGDGLGDACDLEPEISADEPSEEQEDRRTRGGEELYLLTWDGSSWSSLERLTDDDLADVNPRFARDRHGNLILLWARGGRILDLRRNPEAAGSVPGGFDVAQAREVWTENVSTSMAHFSLASSAGGKLALVWPDTERFETPDGPVAGSDIRALFYDETRDLWGAPSRLTADDETEHSLTTTFLGENTLVAVFNRTVSAPPSPAADGSRQGLPVPVHTDLFELRHRLRNDLAIAVDSLRTDPANPLPGEPVVLSVEVLNLGDDAVAGAMIEAWLGDTRIGEKALSEIIGPNRSVATTMSATLPSAVSESAVLSARVDFPPTDPRVDDEPGNNVASLSVARPDLEVFTVGWDRVRPGLLSIDARIVNKGGTLPASQPYTVTFRKDSESGPLIDSRTFGDGLATHESRSLSVNHEPGPDYRGSLWVHVAVRAADPDIELNSANNVRRLRILEDDAPPLLTVPGDVLDAECAAPEGTAVALGDAHAADAFCNSSVDVVHDAPTLFPYGTSAVNWTATDCNGFVARGVQTVVVHDTVGPAISALDVMAECSGPDGTALVPEAGALDACCGDAVTLNHDAPDLFPYGPSLVTWSATDCHGQLTVAVLDVTVVDTLGPMLSVPADVAGVECAGPGGTEVTLGGAAASDVCCGDVAEPSHDAPGLFPHGTTHVIWTATDCHQQSSTGTQAVTVVDTTPPELTAPPSRAAECSGPQGTAVQLGRVKASDTCCGGEVAVDHDAPPAFPLGRTSVTWTATDCHGTTATAMQEVLVRDTVPPAGSVLFPATDQCFGESALAGFPEGVPVDTAFHDACDATVELSFEPSAPPYSEHGDHVVVVRATDQSGNVSAPSTVAFTIDRVRPLVTITTPPPVTLPGRLPVFASHDDDGAEGGVQYELLKLDDCTLFDGRTHGDGDGLLSDEHLVLGQAALCAILEGCGYRPGPQPELRIEAVDCGGNVGVERRPVKRLNLNCRGSRPVAPFESDLQETFPDEGVH